MISNRPPLNLTRLEPRENPAGTFGLTLDTAPWGEQGSSALSVSSGG